MSEHAPDPKRCDACQGTGRAGFLSCPRCDGTGKQRRIVSRVVPLDIPAPHANGKQN